MTTITEAIERVREMKAVADKKQEHELDQCDNTKRSDSCPHCIAAIPMFRHIEDLDKVLALLEELKAHTRCGAEEHGLWKLC